MEPFFPFFGSRFPYKVTNPNKGYPSLNKVTTGLLTLNPYCDMVIGLPSKGCKGISAATSSWVGLWEKPARVQGSGFVNLGLGFRGLGV